MAALNEATYRNCDDSYGVSPLREDECVEILRGTSAPAAARPHSFDSALIAVEGDKKGGAGAGGEKATSMAKKNGSGRTKKLYECPVEGCSYKTAWGNNLKKHKAAIHDIGVTWHGCRFCDFKSKDKGNLKRHEAYQHDIGVVWYCCNINNCKYKTKAKGNLKKHKAHVHDIDVRWFCCNHPGCSYKSKENSHLNKHKRNFHKMSHDGGGEVCKIINAAGEPPSEVEPPIVPSVIHVARKEVSDAENMI